MPRQDFFLESAISLSVTEFDKYDEFIPPELLREAYAKDRLFADEIIERFE